MELSTIISDTVNKFNYLNKIYLLVIKSAGQMTKYKAFSNIIKIYEYFKCKNIILSYVEYDNMNFTKHYVKDADDLLQITTIKNHNMFNISIGKYCIIEQITIN